MTRRAAWVAQLMCVGCDYRARYVDGAPRDCPDCGRFLRMELKRRPMADAPLPERSVVAWPARSRPGGRGRDDSRPRPSDRGNLRRS